MSFNGYSEGRVTSKNSPQVNVGGGFLSIIQDLGDERKVGSTLTVVPIAILFLLVSCYGVMFGFITANTALFYSLVIVCSLGLVIRLKKTLGT